MPNPNLQMFRSDTLVEIGTETNPIDFGFCKAGETTTLPYDILLYNDKDGSLNSDLAKDIEIELLRLFLTQVETSNGLPSQQFTVNYHPVVEDEIFEIDVAGKKWRKVDSFTGLSEDDEVYTFDFTTGLLTFGNGVEGKIPPIGSEIKIIYTPDLNTYGKLVYEEQWLSVKSSGVVSHELHITLEESVKEDNNTIQVLNYPQVTEVIGVWDNPSKTGTNYFTGGSFDSNTGRVFLGTSFSGSTPYVEYKYKIQDDNEVGFTSLGNGEKHNFVNPIPSQNAKKLQLSVTVPSTASTEGGAYIKVILRIYYNF